MKEEDSLRYADGCLKLDRSFDETAFSAAHGNGIDHPSTRLQFFSMHHHDISLT